MPKQHGGVVSTSVVEPVSCFGYASKKIQGDDEMRLGLFSDHSSNLEIRLVVSRESRERTKVISYMYFQLLKKEIDVAYFMLREGNEEIEIYTPNC